MYNIYLPEKDATIYQNYPTQNTGADPILELFKYNKGEIIGSESLEFVDWPETVVSRILMKFQDIEYTLGHEYYLQLNLCNIENIWTKKISIDLVPLLYDWIEGVGNKNDRPIIQAGVSWDSNGTIDWPSPYFSEANKVNYVLDITNDSWLINITPLIEYWSNNDNFGFVIKFASDVEDLDFYGGRVQFFGIDTHTVWGPNVIELTPTEEYTGNTFYPSTDVDPSRLDIIIKNFTNSYNANQTIRFYLSVKDKFQKRTYLSSYADIEEDIILHEDCTYQIVDSITNKIVVPFSTINKIGKSDDGYFVELNTENMYTNRYYKIIFKLINENGNIYIKDNNYNFKIF